MSYGEWIKKKREEEAKNGTSSTSTPAVKQQTSSNSSNGGQTASSYGEWIRNKKETSSIQAWTESANDLLNETQKYFSTWRKYDENDAEYAAISSRKTNLLAQADSWRKQYAGNDDAIKHINSVVSALSSTSNYAVKGFDYYSKWETAEDYQTALKQSEYLKKYEGKTAAKLKAMYKQTNDSDEKDWLTAYIAQVENNEKLQYMLNFNVEAERNTITRLKDFYDRAYLIDNWIISYRMNPDAWTEEEINENLGIYQELYEKYGSVEELKNLIDDKQENLKEVVKVQKAHRLSSVNDPNSDYYDPDFEKYTGYVSTKYEKGFSVDKLLDNELSMGYKDLDYEYINGANNGMRAEIERKYSAFKWDSPTRNSESSWKRKHYDYMTDDEVAIYNYHYAKNGKGKANEYLASLSETLEARANNETVENATEFAEAHPIASSIMSVPLSIGSGFEYMGDVLRYTGDIVTGEEGARLDTNSMALQTNAIRGTVSEMIDWEIQGWDAGAFVYNTFMSCVDSVTAAAFGATGGGIVLGLSAAAQGTNDALARGMSSGQAFCSGLFSGVFECLFERWSIGKFNSLKEVAPESIKAVTKNLAKSMLVNATEEMCTEIANIAYDTIINGEFANYTWDELANGAWKDVLAQVIESGASGALMGFGMGSYSNVVGYAQGKSATAESLYGDNQGALVEESMAINPNNPFAQKMQSRLDAGKNLAGRQLNKLIRQNEQTLQSQDAQSIQSATESRLTELGETGDVTAIAAALTKQVVGKKLSKSENQIISESKYAQRVANEMNAQNIQSGDYSSAWTGNIGTERVNVQEYNRLLQAAQMPQETAEATGSQVVTDAPKVAQLQQVEPVAAAEAPSASVPANDQQITGKLTGKESLQVAEESSIAEISEDGITRQVSTGKAITPKKIVSINGGKSMIETDSGTISADDIQFDSVDTDLLWRSVMQFNGIDTPGANGVIRAYRDGDSVTTYLQGAAQEFKNGYNNMPSGGKYANKLSTAQREIIYELGQKAAGAAVAQQQASVQASKDAKVRKTGSVHYGYEGGTIEERQKTGKKLSEKQAVGVDFAQRLAKSLGITFYFYESYVDKNGDRVYKNRNGEIVKAENGFYDSKDGSIHIDLNAGSYGRGSVLFTVAHELTHFIQDWSPKHYKKLCNILMKGYATKGQSVDELVVNQQAFAKEHGRELTWDEAYDEVIADSMESILADGKVMELMQDIEAADKTLANKVRTFFRDICDLLKRTIQAYSHVKPDSEEGRMVEGMQDIYDQLQRVFAEGVYEGGDNYRKAEKNTTAEGSVKYSPGYVNRSADGGYDFTKSFAEQLQDYLDGVFPQDETFIVGPTPNILLKIGLAKLPVTMDRKHVSYALEGTYPGSEERKLDHMMDKEDLANILAKISDPVAIIQDRQIWQKKPSGYSIDVLVDMEINGKKTLIPINVNQSAYANKTEYDSNKITTVHGDADTVQRLVNALNEHSEDNIAVFYINKEKASEFLQPTGHLISSTAAKLDGFIHRVTDKGSNVKMRISSVTESRQFIQWFGNWKKHPDEASKIVNTDGTPKVMYHGSPAQFTIFDKKKAKSSGAYGSGFYFTDSQSHAATYGQQYSVYLNIRNPLQSGNGTVSRAQVRQFLETVAENEDYSIENYGTYDVDSIVQNIMGKESKVDAFKAIQDISATAIGDMVEATELFNKVNRTKFDGIITATETVAFYPEQIKSATDNIGTFDGGNPDIRFSARKGENDAAQEILEQENAQLKENITHLKELLKLQRTITNGTKFTKTSVEAAARMLKQNANAKGDTAELAKLLNSLYEHIATYKELSWESVKENAQPVVDWLQDHVNIKPQRSEYAQDILSQLHGSRFYLDDTQKAEAAYRFGSFDAYRKSMMGSVIITKDGTSLDSLWQELSAMYPDVFDADITAADQPAALSDAIYRLRNSDTSALEYEYNRDFIAMDLMAQVYDSYWRVSALRTVADVNQAKINRLRSEHYQRMSKLREDNRARIQQLKDEHRTRLDQVRKAYRDQVEKTQKEMAARYQESRKKAINSRNKTAMRHKIKDVVNELNQYLLKGTKDRHVPIELQKAVAEALNAVNMDTVGAEERIAKLKDELLKAKTPEQIQEISRKIDHIQEMGDRMNGRLQKLKDAYDQFVNSDDPLIANSHDEVISNKLQSVIDSVGDTPLRDMTLTQLEDVYDMYRMVLTTIRNANKSFKAKKSESISTIANRVMMEVEKVGGKQKLSMKGVEGIKGFAWNNLKPVYAFAHIGSDAFAEVFNNVRSGEDVWALDITEAREYYLDKSKKYNYDSWDFKKRYNFKSTSGMDFSLDLEQIMSLYAYSKRDQAADHLKKGGIVIDETTEITAKNKLGIPVKFNPTEATAYNISNETLADIIGKLSDEQKSYVDEMQDYLSTVMGAKGNEVSLEMYGIKLFKEKFYFPLKSAHQFMAKAKEQAQGEVKIKNSGFSKETAPKASNPIVLTPFMNVWANHVNEMSMYHAFVLPMEDFYRVYNYKTPTSDTRATESVEMFIQNAYGKGATKYIDQLLKDLNGGARTDSTTGIINKMIGLFKKGAVFTSLSVVVQQPSSIARAAALVDTKYFIGPKVDHKRHKDLWNEVKQYAPVAIIKEMGYFDTNMGKSTQDFILGKEYSSFKDKMKALVTDSGYRDEVLSRAPSLADEIAWCGIWEAVKRELKSNNPGMDVKSDAFLKRAGERFTEVIVRTQVYDSVLSRSGFMRSKDTGMKMATAFMAEPTTSINMVADALFQGKRGNRKYARKTIGAVIASQIINSILVSFVYAGRDDDEDETYVEKYIGTFTGEVIDSLNPAGYIPFIKDIMSIVQGYDVERSDMAVISDLWKAWENLGKDNVATYRKVEGFAGSIAQIFGLPVKNIMRDTRGIYQTVMSFVNGQQTTAAGIGYAVKGAITGQTISDQQQLYEAYLSGDKTHISRVEGRFKDQTAINAAIRKALRENDPRIHNAAVARNNGDLDEYARLAKQIIGEKHFSQDNVVAAINSEINALNKDETAVSTPKESGLYKAEDFALAISQGDQAMANAIKVDIIRTAQKNGKTQEEAENSFVSAATSGLKGLFQVGKITESKAVSALVNYCDKSEEDAVADVRYWAFKRDYPNTYADDAWFDKYYAEVADSGIKIKTYMDYRNQVKDITGEGKKERRMAVIHSMPLSAAQKDALYYAEGWSKSTIYEAPWH